MKQQLWDRLAVLQTQDARVDNAVQTLMTSIPYNHQPRIQENVVALKTLLLGHDINSHQADVLVSLVKAQAYQAKQGGTLR